MPAHLADLSLPDPEALAAAPAFALLRREDEEHVDVLLGDPLVVKTLADIPLPAGRPEGGPCHDVLAAVPFRQVGERGYVRHDDGTPLTCLRVRESRRVPLADAMAALPAGPADAVRLREPGRYEIDDDAYAEAVARVVADEIGCGEGANFVLRRTFTAHLDGWTVRGALAVFRRLLAAERGAYWTFLVYTGERYLVGATPERHVTCRDGEVLMNPISGTFRLPVRPVGAAGLRPDLLRFLRDDKEVFELFMVTDEELKMMSAVCPGGGQVTGPYLKQMSRLVHTEYVLAGRSALDVRDVLRSTMFAATVTGSPVENACRVIARHEPTGRGYYGAVLALFGRDAAGGQTLDAPILIRTADVDPAGRLRVSVGATLVRDSVPADEVAETHAKAQALLAAFGVGDAPAPAAQTVRALVDGTRDPEVAAVLAARNERLAAFWLRPQDQAALAVPELAGRRALVIDGEDEFTAMLRHQMRCLGLEVAVRRHDAVDAADLSAEDLVVVGPGPGDPRAASDPKIARMTDLTASLLGAGRPFLAVCLGHQVLAALLGFPLAPKAVTFQGTQSAIDYFGRPERVGFYNTFVAKVPPSGPPAGVRVSADTASGDVHALAGPHFRSLQFHAESILTEHGVEILREALLGVLRDTDPPSRPSP